MTKKRLIRFIILIITIWIAIRLAYTTYDVWKRRDVVKERQTELNRATTENSNLKRQLEEIQSPDFIEKEARDKLGLVKSGESIVLLSTPIPTGKPLDMGNTSTKSDSLIPIWKQWWKIFF